MKPSELRAIFRQTDTDTDTDTHTHIWIYQKVGLYQRNMVCCQPNMADFERNSGDSTTICPHTYTCIYVMYHVCAGNHLWLVYAYIHTQYAKSYSGSILYPLYIQSYICIYIYICYVYIYLYILYIHTLYLYIWHTPLNCTGLTDVFTQPRSPQSCVLEVMAGALAPIWPWYYCLYTDT